jgi:surface protein
MRSFLLFFTSLLLCSIAHAQVPSSFNYQSVVRDGFNVLIANQPIGVQASIVQDSMGGATLYSETHSVSTNTNGLFSIQIGEGAAVSGSFNSIDWTTADLHYQIEIDLQGGSNYTLTSFHSFTSVPYAMVAQKAVEVESGALPDNANKGDILYSDGSEWKKLAVGSSGQRLTICGDSLAWTYGECEPAGGWNPKGAYIDSIGQGQGCIICDMYSIGETFSIDSGRTIMRAVDRNLLLSMISNQEDLSRVCTSAITDMDVLFKNNAYFNDDISKWDVSNVTQMGQMFWGASTFNRDIGNWDVSSVTQMPYMFYYATSFNQDLSGWCVSNIGVRPSNFSDYSGLQSSYNPIWGTCPN